MKDGLRAAHRRFVATVIGSVVGIVLCFPRMDDGRRIGALRTLEELAATLDPAALEASLLRAASAGASPDLPTIAAEVEGPGVKGLSAGSTPPALFHAQPLGISTLGHVVAYGRGGRRISVEGPELQGLIVGLRWRIGRGGGGAGATLDDLVLVEGSADGAQLTSEANVESHRLEAIVERKAFVKARKRFHHYRDRAKRLKKKKRVSKTLLRKAEGKRREVYEEMSAAQAALDAARERYQKVADAAAAFEPGPPNAKAPGVVVAATVTRDGKATALRVPVPKVKRETTLPAADLPEELVTLSEGLLWPQLHDRTAAEALPPLRAGLSWHVHGREVGPLRVGGATVLQLFSLLLLVSLWRLSRQCHATADDYDPFHHPGPDLPTIGTGSGALDSLLLVGLPLAQIALAAWSLQRIDAQPLVAVGAGVPTLIVAVLARRGFVRLRDLRADVKRTSIMPPAM